MPRTAWLACVLAAFALAIYAPALNLAFIGDDYVFIDKTRDSSFWNLWAFRNTDFGWYRPWSRELHFWGLQRVAGLNPLAFRATSIILWVAALCLYAAVVRRLASPRVASIAALGVAGLALWGTPLLWISGSQDLWMLCFTMASMLLFVTGRVGWALLPFGLALLSKETAAVLPALLGAYLIFVERQRAIDALRRTAPFWALVLVWLAVHPTLHARLLTGSNMTPEIQNRPPALWTLSRTILSTLNLDVFPRPQEVEWGLVLRVVASALVLGIGVAVAFRGRPAGDPQVGSRGTFGALHRFAAAWMAIAWLPLFLPSIGWHAYYGCLGALGAWLALALWLEDRRRVAVVAIIGLALLRGAQANTLTWDWGNESYMRRAGSTLSAIRDELYRQHPALPPHSRVYFAHIPNNIGLIAGQSPALRVWYRDSTLQAGFYSYYRPRPASAPRGEDFFFRFDSAAGMVEVKAGPEDMRLGLSSNANWEDDHEGLAMLFLKRGDASRAAVEFEKLSLLRRRPDAAVFAGVCREFTGDTVRAESLFAAGEARMHLPHARVLDWVTRLRATVPRVQER